MMRSPFVATAVAISMVLRAQLNETGLPIARRPDPQQPVQRSLWSALRVLNPGDEIVVTQGHSTLTYRFVSVDDVAIHTVLASRAVDLLRTSVDKVTVPRRSENKTQFAFLSFVMAVIQLGLLFSVPKRPPLFFILGSAFAFLGGVLLKRTHVVIYERPVGRVVGSRAERYFFT
jgi:hypothetical protein